MRLNRLSVENFGPYNGRHDIDLHVTSKTPVVLIHGENERGKTSFANAIRWCLYRTVYESDGVKIGTFELINWEAASAGPCHMAVRLEFEHQGAQYVLERRVQTTRKPTSDADLDWHETIRRDGHVLPSQQIDRIIRDMLPSEISKFFLFDGEMLNHFKVLLRDSSRNSQVVKQSIEQILGVPALQRASLNLEQLRRHAEQRQMNEAKTRRTNAKLIADAQQKQEELDALERDLQHQREIQQKLEQEKESLRDRRNQFADVQADLRRLDELDAELKKNSDTGAQIREEIKSLLEEGWWMPMETQIAKRIDVAASKVAEVSEARSARREQRQRLAALSKAALSGACETCGQVLSADALRRLEIASAALQAELAAGADEPSHFEAGEALGLLRPFVGSGKYAVLEEKETQVKRLSIDAHALEREVREIKDRVRKDSRTEIAELEESYDECIRLLADANGNVSKTTLKHRETASALGRLQAQIRALPGANKKLAAEAAVFSALKATFDLAVSKFRERLRVEVEKQAKTVHGELTNESGYAGLRINDQYGLMLVNEQGRDILRRSAGSEQIVALSLITALNYAADRDGPVVMDTPLGRLDRGHRAKVLRFAGKMAPQVILLVQSGELDREKDMSEIAPQLAHEYRIERRGASDSSLIRPINAK